MKIHWLPIDSYLDTEILGYRMTTAGGKHSWGLLDWSRWWIDGEKWQYLHVSTVHERHGEVYRVRCWWRGRKYMGRLVESVRVGFKDGELHWIVQLA